MRKTVQAIASIEPYAARFHDFLFRRDKIDGQLAEIVAAGR